MLLLTSFLQLCILIKKILLNNYQNCYFQKPKMILSFVSYYGVREAMTILAQIFMSIIKILILSF